MQYTSHFCSPLGRILLAADDAGLTGLWFEGQKYFARHLDAAHVDKELPVFEAAKRWLSVYFSGREPDIPVPLHCIGTDFQREVWEILCTIPYGKTMTYGEMPGRSLRKEGRNGCLRRQLEVRWGTTKSHSSSPVTGSSVRTAA